tara:strand:+ start:290 stop:517 length:228 start_codon:yes stop_codon:yes gene_type:complete
MTTFKPEVDYEGLKKADTKCTHCKDSLTSENFGEKINDKRGYQLPSTMYLARYGFFCNSCAPKVVKVMVSGADDI